MKKKVKILIILACCFLTVGCFKRDDMEGIDIYTTSYPIEYLVEQLYGESSNVKTIYPGGSDVFNYTLTEKQIKDYSEADLFVYNGLSKEKQIARDFINENKKMKIIDVSYGLNIAYGENTHEELWLSPNNYLMLAGTIKNNLNEFISNKYIKEEIENNFKALEEELSKMDAELRTIASAASDDAKNIIITTTPVLRYLENYGFIVLYLNEDSYTETIVNSFESDSYKYVFVRDDEENAIADDLVNNYKAEKIVVNMMNTLTDEQRDNGEDYINIMRGYLENIKKAVLN